MPKMPEALITVATATAIAFGFYEGRQNIVLRRRIQMLADQNSWWKLNHDHATNQQQALRLEIIGLRSNLADLLKARGDLPRRDLTRLQTSTPLSTNELTAPPPTSEGLSCPTGRGPIHE
jgi:hypothetical protein